MVNGEDREDYLQLCSDAGWKEVAWSGGNVCIFVTDNHRSEPIYTDRSSRLSRVAELNRAKYGSINPYLYIVLLAVGLAAVTAFAANRIPGTEGFFLYTLKNAPWIVCLALMWFMILLRRGLVLITIGLAERRMERGQDIKMSLYPISQIFAVLLPLTNFAALLLIGALSELDTGAFHWKWLCLILMIDAILWGSSALEALLDKKYLSAAGVTLGIVVFIAGYIMMK